MPTPLDWIAPAVLALRPYRHGRSIAEIARERGVSDIIKLSSNENPLGPGKSVLKILREFPTKSLSPLSGYRRRCFAWCVVAKIRRSRRLYFVGQRFQ